MPLIGRNRYPFQQFSYHCSLLSDTFQPCSPDGTRPATTWPASPKLRAGFRASAPVYRSRTGPSPKCSTNGAGTPTPSGSGTSLPAKRPMSRHGKDAGRLAADLSGFMDFCRGDRASGIRTSCMIIILSNSQYSPEQGYHLSKILLTERSSSYRMQKWWLRINPG